MLRILLHGACGVMGEKISALSGGETGIVAGVDRRAGEEGISRPFPLYRELSEIREDFDVIVDFSVPEAAGGLLRYACERGKPLVFCTTGLSEEELSLLEEASRRIPILRSANMSLGINLLTELVKLSAAKLYERGFDIEILEEHHRRKKDAPSGTALMLADAVDEAIGERLERVFDRTKRRTPRPKQEIGISSLRGGSIPGVHELIFAGEDEILTLSHTAYSRGIFAKGALSAALWIAGREPGLYSMRDVLFAS
ncbi:dihydrodipicolinate reductase [Oribacterium sp. oral taxon 078 str. F0263]|uniref:4-hydroxy-tetrahydrodipicolinate reductase n=1 Tax=Oribacterium sp. oral taxon 078 TaxID=652706 RepID=UPI0003AE340E|nr:4-hydroxy-tetrahydrodipicolinate reductase [Oribacterium sp. oral taxon 078]ERL21303.1 dihydrodipicolinate reductase [Oribacterium sp. oral taxon 078 str. F0263]